ncbi:MAG: TetR/AcrR family transcriptional regulator [Microthrixaceae bacterium]|nr:TetR/AcrR family transcriptional regulator [Microthrixaceae bacterium]
MGETDRYEGLGLRERKKAITRDTIIETAERLFEAKGFDQVSVAEIARAANVSVKTLFVYFRSKDDLVFTDTSLIDSLLDAIRSRPEGTSPEQAVIRTLDAMLATEQSGITSFRRGYSDAEGLRNGLLRMWADYEDRITDALADEHPGQPLPDDRYRAIQLVGLIRTIVAHELANLGGRSLNTVARSWLQQSRDALPTS